MKVQLLTLGEVDRQVLEELSAGLHEAAEVETRIEGRAELVAEDRDKKRDKYRSSLVLHRLPQAGPEESLLAVTGADLQAGGWHFVYGHADPASRRAVVSLARMRKDDEPAADLRRRLLVESLHELGHLRGLEHCDQARCAMTPYYTPFEFEQRSPEYCLRCAGLLGLRARATEEAAPR